jgi:hypothetical protein
MGVGGHCHALAALFPGQMRYPLCRWLDGSRCRSGWVQRILPLLGINPRTVQPVTSHYPGPLKVKQSLYRPGQTLGVLGVRGSQISRDSRHMKVVRLSPLCTGCLPPPPKYSWYSFLLEAELTPGAIVQPEELCP